MGSFYIGSPVPKRIVDSILQCFSACRNRIYSSSQQLHAKDIELLAFHIHSSHINFTCQSEFGSCSSSCNAMLASACLSNYSFLAHIPRKQCLAQSIIYLMGAGVRQIFPLKVYFTA